MSRERLPNRRQAESFEITHAGIAYVASVSRYRDGRLAEIFLSATKSGSYSDALARDAAIVASLALQGGVPAELDSTCPRAGSRWASLDAARRGPR